MKPPLIALIGRPNTGKSTLLNTIVGSNISIVDDEAGVTRDRVYADTEWNGRKLSFVDTGGLDFDETILDGLHREIMEETGLIVYVDRLLYAVTAIMPTKSNDGAVGLVYICHTDSDTVTLSHEHTEYLWATKIQLMELLSKPVLDDYSNNGVFEALDID